MRIHVLIFLLFLIFSVEEGATSLTPKKFTIFTGKIKVGPKFPFFLIGLNILTKFIEQNNYNSSNVEMF